MSTPTSTRGPQASGERWWPSQFGREDQHGMLNHLTDASRLAALRLVREGRVYHLGRVLDESVPVFPAATSARRW